MYQSSWNGANNLSTNNNVSFTGTINKSRNWFTNSPLNLPSGAYKIRIKHSDATALTDIQVNNSTLQYNQTYIDEATINHVSKEQGFCKEVQLETNGTRVEISVIYPSSHPINLESI